MRISTLTKNELLSFSALTKAGLLKIIWGKSYREILALMRNLQIALAVNSRKIPLFVQGNIIGQITIIERSAKRAFFRESILRAACHGKKDFVKVKAAIRGKWEEIYRREAY